MSTPICLLFSLLITLAGQAQTFRFQAPVDPVQQSGFYRIQLPASVVGQLNNSLTDIRIFDSKQAEVPYRLIRQVPRQTTAFVDYEVFSKQSRPNKSTTVVIRNPAKTRINSLEIIIKNTNVGKKARLSGSSDAHTWYAIDDDIWLEPSRNNGTTTDSKTLPMPLSDYAYYRIEINDSLSTPLNIMRVGYYRPVASAGAYSPIPDLVISQRDSSDKNTYIRLSRRDNARFDKVSILASAPSQYHRQATIGLFRTRKGRRKRLEKWFDPVRSFELSSADSNVVYLPGLRASELYVVIANEDNPPLTVQTVRAAQLTTYLLANLTAGQDYTLHFSAADLSAPAYDLTPFKAVIPQQSPVLRVGALLAAGANGQQTASFFTDNRIIWPALGLVLLIVGILSYRMLKEMGNVTE